MAVAVNFLMIGFTADQNRYNITEMIRYVLPFLVELFLNFRHK